MRNLYALCNLYAEDKQILVNLQHRNMLADLQFPQNNMVYKLLNLYTTKSNRKTTGNKNS